MWVKLHDRMPQDGDIDRLSDGAFRVYVAALCWSSSEMSDGVVPVAMLHRLVPRWRPCYLPELTEDHGHPDGPVFRRDGENVTIRNFLKFNLARADLLERQARTTRRVAEWRSSRGM